MGARYTTHLTPRVGRAPRVHDVRRKPYSTSPVAFAMTNLHRSWSSARRRRVLPSLLEIRSLIRTASYRPRRKSWRRSWSSYARRRPQTLTSTRAGKSESRISRVSALYSSRSSSRTQWRECNRWMRKTCFRLPPQHSRRRPSRCCRRNTTRSTRPGSSPAQIRTLGSRASSVAPFKLGSWASGSPSGLRRRSFSAQARRSTTWLLAAGRAVSARCAGNASHAGQSPVKTPGHRRRSVRVRPRAP